MSSNDFNQGSNSNFKRFDIPVKMGIILSIALCLCTVISYMVILKTSYAAFIIFNIAIFIGTAIFYGFVAAQQRKAMGGFINIKEAFQAIFVVILISTLAYTVWGIIYSHWIDPGSVERMKESTLTFMKNMKVPQESLEKAAENFDKQAGKSIVFSKVMYGVAGSLIVSSIIGLICAAIVKRDPPAEMR